MSFSNNGNWNMDPQTDRSEVQAAWRALDHAEAMGGQGWKTIRVALGGPCQVRAGRRFPGNEEALLVGFRTMRLPKAELLPTGHGFAVTEEDLGAEGAGQTWVALCRQPAGSRELFGVMTEDIAGMLRSSGADKESAIFHAFLARIRAWQEFMQRGSGQVLSTESEVGLYGELLVLRALVHGGMSHFLAVDCWFGPTGGVRDFSIGKGGIEVKSTVASGSFPARIGSLDQLDDDLVKPLYLACVRLVIAANGRTLAEAVQETRDLLAAEPVARREFDSRLLRSGYIDLAADQYTRRFNHLSTRFLAVADGVPRLVRGNVQPGITRAQYEIDLDLVAVPDHGIAAVLKSLGGIV